jgi:hypothetical protein
MDGYVLGFLVMMGFMVLVAIAALFFLSIESAGDKPRYTRVTPVDTNTIETVDVAGQVQRWTRSS